MSDRDELRRLVDTPHDDPAIQVMEHELRALLDAADRGDRAIELLRRGVGGHSPETWLEDERQLIDETVAFLAEVDA